MEKNGRLAERKKWRGTEGWRKGRNGEERRVGGKEEVEKNGGLAERKK